MIKITTPLAKDVIRRLKAGDEVCLSGVVFTARDEAHKRLAGLIKKSRRLPIRLEGAVIYYAGPAAARPGRPIGSCGPTTSSRMDAFAPALIKRGLAGMIGKGTRSEEVKRAIRRYGSVYLLAPGGLGALLARKVKSCRVIAYKDLGPEAIHALIVKDFPLIVGIDAKGRDVYGSTRRKKV